MKVPTKPGCVCYFCGREHDFPLSSGPCPSDACSGWDQLVKKSDKWVDMSTASERRKAVECVVLCYTRELPPKAVATICSLFEPVIEGQRELMEFSQTLSHQGAFELIESFLAQAKRNPT